MRVRVMTGVCVLAAVMAAGCQDPAGPVTPSSPNASAEGAAPGESTTNASAAPESEPMAVAATAPADPATEEKPTEEKPNPEPPAAEAPVAAAVNESPPVLLGSPELTAGIAGEGPLTLPQIQAWLDDPRNHEVLRIELPVGLRAGVLPEATLAKNPITRAKVELGRQLYFDPRLSSDQTVSCASCHDPNEGYGRHTQFGVGIESKTGNRNSPVSYNRIFSAEQFWDGRAKSLEEQAIGPIANPIEMGNTHDACVECLKGIAGYKLQFDKVFGSEGLTIDTVAKAIATFERVLVTGPSPFDYYERLLPFKDFTKEDYDDDPDLKADYEAKLAESKAHPMSESAIRGRELFFSQRVNCAHCHVGANLADEKYHNLGIGMDKPEPDLGRFAVTKVEADKGAFKTPTIRNVALSGPYMHDGSLKTLLDVVEHYNKGGTPNPQLSPKVVKLNLTEQEKLDLVAFMEACTGDFPKVEAGRLPE